MTSFDFCNKCNFPRYVEGYRSIQDYLDNGWVKYEYRVLDKHGVRSTISNWRCPVCAHEDEVAAEKEILMRIGSVDEGTGAFGATKVD